MINIRFYKILGSFCILFVFFGTAFANGPQPKYKSQASGNFSTSVIDSNDDGVPGVEGFLQGESTFGSLTIHFFSEFDFLAAAPSENCPEGYLELPLVNSKTIHRHRNGDLLLLETISEVFCGDLVSGEFLWEETLVVIGGTGKFINASGTLESYGNGFILISDAAGVTSWGALFISNVGKIKLNGKD
jgi:hypothetical protein